MESKEVDLKDYLKILYKNRYVFLFVLLIIFVFTAIPTFLSPKIYEANTTLIFSGGTDSGGFASFGGISIPVSGGGDNQKGGLTMGPSVSFLSSLMGKISSANYSRNILQSRKIRTELAKRLDFYKYYHTNSNEFVISLIKNDTSITVDNNGILTITTKARSPELAMQMANTYVELLRDYNNNNKLGMAKKRRIFLESQLTIKKRELKDVSLEMQNYTAKYKIFDIEGYSQNIQGEKSTLDKEKNINDIEINQFGKSLENMKKELTLQLKASKDDFSQFNAAIDVEIKRTREELINRMINRAVARRGRSDKHPVVAKINLEISSLEDVYKQQLEKYIKNVNSDFPIQFIDLQTKYYLALAKKEALQKRTENYDKYLRSIPKVIMDYMDLKREFETKKITCAMLENDLESTRVAEAQEMPDLEVLDMATPPDNYSYPKVKTNLLIGLMFGCVLGLISAVAWEYIDKNVINDIIRKSRTLYPGKR